MKLRKVLSSVVAGALALSAMTFSASAEGATVIDFEDGAFTGISMKTDDGGDKSELSVVDYNGSKQLKVDIQKDKLIPKVFFNVGEIVGYNNMDKVAKFTCEVTMQSTAVLDESDPENILYDVVGWQGGAVGAQDGTGGSLPWTQAPQWSIEEYSESFKTGTLEIDLGGATFTNGTEGSHILVMKWANESNPVDMYIDNVKFLDADGNALEVYPSEEAAEEEATEEVEEEAAEEEVEEEATEEEVEEEATEEVEEEAAEEEVDDDAALEPDWDAYDADAMAAMNEEFVLGGNIDIYSVVGDDWADIATIEADFVWTPGLGGWCGGAGIGNGAVAADGSTWISGPEYGAANANSKYEPDGKATQVLVDLSANPLTAIASVGDDGETVFAQLMVQNWWNGVEAGAQVAAVRFLDADGNVIGELTYDVEAPVVEEVEEEVEEDEAPATGDVDASTDSSKGSPDTGVEDVAVVAGLAIVAAGAVLVSKKRK